VSKEAKVGLLLGLFFIAGIALVLRGVHQQRGEVLDQSLSVNGDMLNPPGGVAGQHPDFPQAVNQLADPWREPAAAAVPGQAKAGAERPTGQGVSWQSGPTRWEQELPGSEEASGQTVVASGQPVPAPRRDALAEALQEVTTPVNEVDAVVAAGVAPARSGEAPFYVTEKGDDLSRVALRVYGPTEGKRWVNVKRLYEANKETLASMNTVRVGQKLRIPPLPEAQPAGAQTASAPTASEQGRTCVVKEHDTLWGIAASELGSGVRFKEIQDLNRDVLKRDDKLVTGMKLKLPAR